MERIEILAAEDFDFQQHLTFLGRSADETSHFVEDDQVYTLLAHEGIDLAFAVSATEGGLGARILHGNADRSSIEAIKTYMTDWFDLDRDLTDFYELAAKDSLLAPIVKQYRGLRIIGLPNLFESLAWAVIGQQINLTFAYRLKRRMVENFGRSLELDGRTFWHFPEPAVIAQLAEEDLKAHQFSIQKARYVIGIARLMADGRLSKQQLLAKENPQEMRATLLEIKGVGGWTADYVMMKCLRQPGAFPIQDVGLHNAIRKWKQLDRKPSIPEIEKMSKKWRNWEAYATFYLWRSLYE